MSDKEKYIRMEINYLKENGRTIEDKNYDLFPIDWYLIKNYALKTEILFEAIENKIKVIDTKKYNEYSSSK